MGQASLVIQETGVNQYILANPTTHPTFDLILGQRGTSEFTLCVKDGSGYAPLVGQQVAWFDENGHRMWVGSIDSVQQILSSRVADGIKYVCACNSLERRLDKRFLLRTFLNSTDGQCIKDLLTGLEAGAEGILEGTILDGQTNAKIFLADIERVSDFFTERAAANTDYQWYVDPGSDLQFGPASGYPAPFTLDDPKIIWDGLSLEYDRADLRNRQWIRVSDKAISTERQVFETDGYLQVFLVDHPILEVISATFSLSTAASLTGTFRSIPADGDTVVLEGDTTYTFKTVIDNRWDNQVLIGASIEECCDNLVGAINDAPFYLRGVNWSFPTFFQRDVRAESSGPVLTLKHRWTGKWANGIVTVAVTSASYPAFLEMDGPALDGATDGEEIAWTFGEITGDGDPDIFFYQGEQTFLINPNRSFVHSGRVRVEFRAPGFDLIELQDDAAVAARQAVEGLSGVYEHLLDRTDITFRGTGITVAQQQLARYNAPSKTLKFKTLENGLYPGQTLTVDSVRLGLNEDFTVQQVEAEFLGTNDIGHWRYSIVAVSGGAL